MTSTTNTQYETLYGIGLLDDLHNYFPAILYDSGRFQNVQQLLHYIQTNARDRFDLFSFGQRNYLNTTLEAPIQQQAPPQQALPGRVVSPERPAPVVQNMFRPARRIIPETLISAHIDLTQEDLGFDNQALSLLNLVNLLGGMPNGGAGQRAAGSFLDPVIVRPTEQQIERGSTRAFPSEETTCTICQDPVQVVEMARRLNVCGHFFHIRCIDQWFRRSVHCPTCRHDIREPAAPNNERTATETQATPSVESNEQE